MAYVYKPTPLMLPTSHYDKRRADFAVNFISMLKHTTGEWYLDDKIGDFTPAAKASLVKHGYCLQRQQAEKNSQKFLPYSNKASAS